MIVTINTVKFAVDVVLKKKKRILINLDNIIIYDNFF